MRNSKFGSGPQKLLIAIRSSLWFYPIVVILLFIGIALGMLEIDQHFGDDLHQRLPRLLATDAEGARSMLSAIAGSMATITGVAFSIVIVALVLASTQYTSRVLRTFMRDRATQMVLGVFVGVYIYCLLVLRTLINTNVSGVSSLSVLGGLILAIVSLGFFIFFIHHISSSIQASAIVAAITRETLGVIDVSYPEKCTEMEDEKLHVGEAELDWKPILSQGMGYIQTVDIESLSALAHEYRIIIRMDCEPGDFVAPSLPILSYCGSDEVKKALVNDLHRYYAIDTFRTIEQDPSYGVRQLVDIALKALSPGINDTTTAVICIEHLSVILMHVVQRRTSLPLECSQYGARIIAKASYFDRIVALSFNQILESSSGNTEIHISLIKAIAQVASVTTLNERKLVLQKWLDIIEEFALRSTKSDYAADLIMRNTSQTKAGL